MKKIRLIAMLCSLVFLSCNEQDSNTTTSGSAMPAQKDGQEAVDDQDSMKDVVKVAVASADHTTLVAALKQAELVTALANAGPFTVFAPTNDAFAKVDKATLDALMTDERKTDLQHILEYHVTLSSIKAENLRDGQNLGMVNGENITVSVKDGKVMLNNIATIVASVPASNGIVHVIDAVLLPPTK
jgi:uncharacterized surface protein with fasciclin (FAS1) repeats